MEQTVFADVNETLQHMKDQYAKCGEKRLMTWVTSDGKWIDESVLQQLVSTGDLTYTPPKFGNMYSDPHYYLVIKSELTPEPPTVEAVSVETTKPAKAQPKCQLCKFNPAVHAMQYIADETPSFYALGSHIRGFPVTKVCDACKRDKRLGCINIGARMSEFTCDEKELAMLQYWFSDKMDKSMMTVESLERELKKRKSMLKDAIKHPEWKSIGDPKVLSRQIEMVEFAMSIVRLTTH